MIKKQSLLAFVVCCILAGFSEAKGKGEMKAGKKGKRSKLMGKGSKKDPLSYGMLPPYVALEESVGYAFTPEDHQALLPPSPKWDGESMKFAMDPSDDWATPSEASGFMETATYQEIVMYCRRLTEASKDVELISLAKLAKGEDILMLVVSSEKEKTPKALQASGKPIVFIHAAIHSGESMGVNAGLMMVRDMVITGTQQDLLDKVNLIFVPVLNVQGYLRQATNARSNQYGPNSSGTRGNMGFYNLNRDWAKLDTPEVRAMVRVMTDFQPHFYIDAHSTDGMNYQYDVTWCDNGASGLSPGIYDWMRNELTEDLSSLLEGLGHIPGTCIYGNNGMSPEDGYYPYFTDGPAFSASYADHRQIPGYLLEMHSLKPFKQRVLGAYSFYLGVMDIVGNKADSLVAAIKTDQETRIDPVPLTWDYDDPAPMVDFKSFEYEIVTNSVLGIDQIVWSDAPVTLTVEQSVRSTAVNPVKRPTAYYVPAVWSEVLERIQAHGIEIETLKEQTTVDVVRYRFDDFDVANPNREGRAIASGTPVPYSLTMTYKEGDVRIKTDQLLGTLAVTILEPTGESSFFYWGFFNSIMTVPEYGENYIFVPIAEEMLSNDPEIAAEWSTYVADNPEYTSDPDGVINWFFKRSAFYDQEAFLLPIGIEY